MRNRISIYKGIAILMIIMAHSVIMPYSLPDWFKHLMHFGQFGCQVFFAISGYCLCQSYTRTSMSTQRFYLRRFKSIAVGYWMILAFTCIVGITTATVFGHNVLNTDTQSLHILYNALFVHGLTPGMANNGVVRGGWYVGTLVILYILFPIIFHQKDRIVSKFGLQGLWVSFALDVVVTIIAISMILGRSHQDNLANNSFLYFSFINQYPSFVAGIIAFFACKYHSCHGNHTMREGFSVFLWLASVYLFFQPIWRYQFYVIPIAVSMATMLLLLNPSPSHPIESRICGILASIGDNSYSIYLVHTFVLYEGYRIVAHFFPEPIRTGGCLYFALLPLFAIAIYWLSEYFRRMVAIVKNLIWTTE